MLYRAIRSQPRHPMFPTRGQDDSPMLFDYVTKGAAIRQSARRMFLYIAEPAVKSHPGERSTLSHLGDRARNMFELSEAVNMFAEACWMADRPLSPTLTNFDHVTLTGGLTRHSAGAEKFSLWFSFTDPRSGEKRQVEGFFDATVP